MTKVSPIHAKMDLKDLLILFNAAQILYVTLLARGRVCFRFCHFYSNKIFLVDFLARGPAFSDTAPPFLSQEGQLGICFYIDNIEIEKLLCYYLTGNKK